MSQSSLKKGLGPQWEGVGLTLLDTVDSTNDWLKSHSGSLPRLVVAKEQTGGRGSHGRVWCSPLGGLYWSLETTCLDRLSTALPLVVGVSIAQVLQALGFNGVGVKWPNDLLVNGAKLGGILVERVYDSGHAPSVIVGVGINTATPEIAAVINGRSVIGLNDIRASDANPLDGDELIGRMARAVLDATSVTADALEQNLQARWSAFDVLNGQPVKIEQSNGDVVEGNAVGITDAGALRVLTAAGESVFYSGDCQLKSL